MTSGLAGVPEASSPDRDVSGGSGSTPATVLQDRVGRSVRLTTLATFSGEDMEDLGAFSRWLHKLGRMAELYHWTDQEKLIQFELLLTGQAEKLYELLPGSDKETFEEAVEALRKRLTPVRREAHN